MTDRLLTTRQLADSLGVSTETVLRRWRAGEIPGYRLATTYEFARIMGTSVGMIEAHYGALLDTAHNSLLSRLERDTDDPAADVPASAS